MSYYAEHAKIRADQAAALIKKLCNDLNVTLSAPFDSGTIEVNSSAEDPEGKVWESFSVLDESIVE